MSLASMQLVWEHSRSVGTTRVVLLAIADHDGDGGAWPSMERLALHANVDRRNVQRAIAKLVELGEIKVHPNAGAVHRKRADQRPNLYEITIRPGHRQPVDNSDGEAPHGAADSSPRDSNGAALTVERGGAGDATGRRTRHPNRPELPRTGRPDGEARSSETTSTDLDLLRIAFRQTPALRNVSWRRLTDEKAQQVADLARKHGVRRLVEIAMPRAAGVRYVQAFLDDWHELTADTPTATSTTSEPRCWCGQVERVHDRPAFNDHTFEPRTA